MRYQHAHRRNGHGPYSEATPNGDVMAYGTIAQFNRWTHDPHEHKREINRRMIQEGNRLFREDLRKINAA